jgi:hypothetical protein
MLFKILCFVQLKTQLIRENWGVAGFFTFLS